ncbi:hypothetical protein ZIOFF_074369 (mitochondrion) [Zingiber officinale]|uniref:RNA-dependent RNA polymerase n=1 Tax=Zingiber officinale TaxID=94328 RepID=A0A8J5ET72_ZINOF|nr:hypothetical protein ZIOFF_074369 [Zingiber officinale]
MPWLPKYDLYKGIEWKPTWKSTPNDDRRFKTFPGAIGVRILANVLFWDITAPRALFSLSHHYLVWLAAILEYPKIRTPFKRYALLGDDIVIADRKVARRYKELLTMLGVSISESKSIDSKVGAPEFAKQFWVNKVQTNLTPVSAKAVLASSTFLGMCQLAEKSHLKRDSLIRLAGAGFRVRARLRSPSLSLRWKRLLVCSDRSLSYLRLPLSLWFGRGNPINPYLKGIIVAKVLEALKPKELVLVPSKYWEGDSDSEAFMEYTLYRNWSKLWLEWVQWHAALLSDPDPSLDDLFNPPMVPTHWKRSLKDNSVVRYGVLWKCWDLGDEWTIMTLPPCLTALRDRYKEKGAFIRRSETLWFARNETLCFARKGIAIEVLWDQALDPSLGLSGTPSLILEIALSKLRTTFDSATLLAKAQLCALDCRDRAVA